MIYDTILARSFSRYEQKRFGYGAFVGCLLIILSICTVFKPYLYPIRDLNLKLSMGVGFKMLMVNDTSSSQQIAQVEDIVTNILVNDTKTSPQMVQVEGIEIKNVVDNKTISPQIDEGKNVKGVVAKILVNEGRSSPQKAEHVSKTSSSPQIAKVKEIITNKVEPLCTSEERTDFCETYGDIRVHGNSSYVYVMSPETSTLAENMSWRIRPYARKEDGYAMSRVREWSVKAVRVAKRKFNGEVQFLITDKRSWWISKYHEILNKLSNYELMDIDRDEGIHCFPSVIVGLKRYHKELSIDPQKYFYSMKDFRDFLRSSYSLQKVKAIRIRDGQRKKPKLLILSRKRTRSFTNIDQIVKLAKGLGFKVVAMEANGNMSRFAEIVNSCDALMGVHGAGLTNIVFLPKDAIFIQVVPYGGVEWLATNYFGEPSKDMHLNYLEYKIRLEESTLIQQYPLDHVFIKEPISIQKAGWDAFRSVYLDKQNVMLDVSRFKPTLLKALELLHQ
ncbi:hypothetical protein L6164_005376 [Bauhinia variegata]|uniref:Uncharacterized protein n=1 Tax=Bauhinia variegata TaxID=167791 RepID=A0ACB9PWJ6_BAUVA|nr:hypothetical protein L6164_005376 [Bauhinia variegata]